MKRLLATLTLIVCLSFPAYAGHVIGTGTYCECGTKGCVEDYPGECGGHFATQQDTPTTDYSGLGIVLVGLLLWLRTRA